VDRANKPGTLFVLQPAEWPGVVVWVVGEISLATSDERRSGGKREAVFQPTHGTTSFSSGSKKNNTRCSGAWGEFVPTYWLSALCNLAAAGSGPPMTTRILPRFFFLLLLGQGGY